MRSCPRCGAENSAEHKFCSSCGLMLATATPQPADETTPGWLHADDTERTPARLDDSWLSPGARVHPGADAADTPDWLRRDELEASVAPAAEPENGSVAQSVDELPDWLRDIADESRQRLDARTQETVVPEEQPQPVLAPSLSNADDIPDWLREITADANAPAEGGASERATASPAAGNDAAGADVDPPWLRDQPPAAAPVEHSMVEVVDAEVVAVEVETRHAEPIAGTTGIPAEADSDWQLDGATSLAIPAAGNVVEEAHARVYDVPADSIWSAQPDRPAADGTTGQQTPIWAVPDETARAIVAQPDSFQLPSWLEDDDIESAPAASSGAWSPPSWLEDADVDGPPPRRQSTSWAPPSWLDDDDSLPVAKSANRGGFWQDGRGGGAAVAGGTAVMAAAVPSARPVEGHSAELLQRLLAEPSPELAIAGAPGRGGSTMLVVIVVVLLVMAALVVVFAAPALGFNLF